MYKVYAVADGIAATIPNYIPSYQILSIDIVCVYL